MRGWRWRVVGLLAIAVLPIALLGPIARAEGSLPVPPAGPAAPVLPPLAVEPSTGETHLRHHISPNGFYRGRKVVRTKNDE